VSFERVKQSGLVVGCRILVIGHPGAGKSTLSFFLQTVLKLPLIHLDKHFWKPGWEMISREEWGGVVSELVRAQEWIMDGNYNNTLEIRLQYADTVLFLDFPRWICMYGVLKRIILNYGKVREDMTPGCPERFDMPFLKWCWNFRRHNRPDVLEKLSKYGGDKNVIILTGRKQVRKFMTSLSNSGNRAG